MNKNYKLLFLIILMLLVLTSSLLLVNHKTTVDLVHKQIKEQSIPLSLDNIYTDIQKHILRPYLITSMMSNDTFVKEWILNDKRDENTIKKYLSTIKEEYGLLSAILVSDKSKNYYTQDGFLETLSRDNRDNSWYFRFKNSPVEKEINIDKNEKIDSQYIMFMNNKIFDDQHQLIGITSTGVRIQSVHKMLERFIKQYHLEVYIYNNEADIILSYKKQKNLYKIKEFQQYIDILLSKSSELFDYTIGDNTYVVNKKYIEELDLHILVKADIKDFTDSLEDTFYLNFILSFIMTFIIALIIAYIVRSSINKLEKSNEQKDILLKEVHHRVKNNLNIIGSMLGLQAMQESKEIKPYLLKSKSRIDAIATVHELLYTYDNFKEINFYEYVMKIEFSTSRMFGDASKFTLEIDVDKSMVFPLDTMIQFGLMINEMFTNTVKYAKNGEGLKIYISLQKEHNSFVFAYKDNGAKELDILAMNNSKGLGSKIINICARQLDAIIEKDYNCGLKYKIIFKV